jgi:hypothetical protein
MYSLSFSANPKGIFLCSVTDYQLRNWPHINVIIINKMKTFSDSNDIIEMCQLSSQSYFPIRNADQNIIGK